MPTNSDQMLASVNQGPPQHHESTPTTVTVNTGDVTVNQQANGGDVNGSGNVAVAGSGNQTATATATTTVDQTSTGEDNHHGNEHHGNYGGPEALGPQNSGHDQGGNFNGSENNADASNVDVTKVETDVTAGDGGSNFADINTGIIGNFYCEKGGCTYNITTGSVTLNQQANGGNVNAAATSASGFLPRARLRRAAAPSPSTRQGRGTGGDAGRQARGEAGRSPGGEALVFVQGHELRSALGSARLHRR